MKLVKRRRCILFLLMLLSLLFFFRQPPVFCDETVTVEGVVREHSTGNPLPNANISVEWSYWLESILFEEEVYSGKANINGSFAFEFLLGPVPDKEWYWIYAEYDDPLTPGVDYVPAEMEIDPRLHEKFNITLELWDGASVILEGKPYFLEFTEISSFYYRVKVPDTGGTIQIGENYLLYRTNHLIVPAGIPFNIEVYAHYRIKYSPDRWGYVESTFLIDKPEHFVLSKFDVVHLDMGWHSLRSALSKVGGEASEIGLMIEGMEKKGFYLGVERQSLALVNSLTLEVEELIDQGFYEDSYTKLRRAYLEVLNIRDTLKTMNIEALRSAYFLIPFLAFAATVTSIFLFEKSGSKAGGSMVLYSLFLLALYLLYPGSHLVEVSLFLKVALISLLTALSLAILVPRALKGREIRGRVPLRNLIVPIFSIAKRSMKRRKLRFVFTLTSVLILVSSFITLTSFTTGFGLTFGRVSSQPDSFIGVLVRAARPLEISPKERRLFWFSPLDNSTIEWFEARTDTLLVAPKYENLPRTQYPEAYNPLGYVSGTPIFGVMGITPSRELLPMNETVIEGGPLKDADDKGILISEELKERLNLEVGERLTLTTWDRKTLELEVIGIFDDERFKTLRDLDGESPLPRKIIDADPLPPDETGLHIREELEPCSTDEILVVTSTMASEIYGLHLSRLDLLLNKVEDSKEYIQKIVLIKGLRAWASTEEGVYLAQLAYYFKGKGLPIAVPWAIVVVNVVVTMLNSLYERRREIFVYSSIGMSPSQISGLFIAEALAIGFIGGGVGYLLGLGWYRVMSLLEMALQIRQKLSALWVLAAMAVSMAAVLVGGLIALKGSVVITPSLRRRWRIEERPKTFEPLELTLPLRVPEAEVEEFVEFLTKKLRSHMDDLMLVTEGIRVEAEETDEASIRRIKFIYRSAAMKLDGAYTKNKVVLRREKDSDEYTAKHMTEGTAEGVLKAGTLIRKIIMQWSVERGKLEGDE